jgi:hypothetical protein
MDLRQLEQQDTAEYVLLTPAGDKTDVVFTLAGATHPIREAFEKRATTRNLRDFNKKGRATLPEDPDDIKDLQVDRLTACTLGWEGMMLDGKDYPFSPQNARQLYDDVKFAWLRDQVDAALRAVENFIKTQSPN